MRNPGHTGLTCQDQSTPLPGLEQCLPEDSRTDINGAEHLLVSWEMPLSSGSPLGHAAQADAEWKCYCKAVTEALKQEMVQTQ